MKKLQFLFLLFIIIATKATAQLCIGYVPETQNFGYCLNISSKTIGAYAHYRTGNIVIDGFSCNEMAVGGGLSWRLEYGKILVGSSYNELFDIINPTCYINPKRIYKYSLDFGAVVQLPKHERVHIYIFNDVLNWHTEIGIGLSLKKSDK